MSPVFTEQIQQTILATDYNDLSWMVGIVALVLLVMLLVQQELARGYGGKRAMEWVRTVEVVTIPLFFSFAAIVLLRLLYLLGFR